MQSYLISILVSCVAPVVVFGEGDSWDYNHQWICDDPPPHNLKVKAYREMPYTKTETIDLFNRFPVSEVPSEQ